MRGKLAFLILAVGATSCGLLALRQQRLEAVHELARVQRQLTQMDQDLYRARVAIATAITPSQVTRSALALGPMRPIGVDPLLSDEELLDERTRLTHLGDHPQSANADR